MASDFARRRFEWLDQVLADREITPAGFQVAYAISSHVNRDSGSAFPSQETLASKIGITVRGVRNLTDALAVRGHLQITESRGRGHSIRYKPIVTGQGTKQEEMFPEAAAPEANRTAPTGATSPKKANGRTPASAVIEAAFDEWWMQYPKKVSKGDARRAYEKVVRSGKATPTELLAGAMRYGAERAQQEQRYTKHPGRWLRAECWRDEPAEVGPPISDARPRSSSWTETALKGFTDE
jgi:hypothetical protein